MSAFDCTLGNDHHKSSLNPYLRIQLVVIVEHCVNSVVCDLSEEDVYRTSPLIWSNFYSAAPQNVPG